LSYFVLHLLICSVELTPEGLLFAWSIRSLNPAEFCNDNISGRPFAKEEGLGRRSRSAVEFETFHSSTSTSHFDSVVFSFKQPQKIAERYTRAKVTTRNMATTNAVIVAYTRVPDPLWPGRRACERGSAHL